ncbi:hypothetical protein [Caballeronia sp. ATUFL_M2_KS44]|uniref:hypothetical protein n=1 Tax=Caballeronia sp. ATUFL_M2_KS44 TaxID=2921767 RepID=UPI00202930C1|nr:hypothetical protein [Caballeronia sp. ATUFL_M2_KS44]
MRRGNFSVACLVVALSISAVDSFAQSTSGQDQAAMPESSAQASTNMTSPPTSGTSMTQQKSRADVMRELSDFQASGGAAKMLDIYKGGS